MTAFSSEFRSKWLNDDEDYNSCKQKRRRFGDHPKETGAVRDAAGFKIFSPFGQKTMNDHQKGDKQKLRV